MKTILVLLSIALMTVGLGCAALSSYVTPAEIDPDAVEYIVNNGDGHIEDYKGWPWPNLLMANKLNEGLDDSHEMTQFQLRQHMEDDSLRYSQHKDVVASNLVMAQQREEMLFGETGLLSLGLSMAGMGGFAGLLGLMRKRPGDITPPEMESALATATGKTTAELSAKEKQFIQLVKGVQSFMDTNHTAVPSLKFAMDSAQDESTRAAVAVVKATA